MNLPITVSFGGKPKRGWLVLYPGAGGNQNPDGMPAVLPALRRTIAGWIKYIQPVEMNQAIQWIQYQVLKLKNPDANDGRFTALYKSDKALTNNAGFGDPNDPRWNYITGDGAGYPLPKLMDAIIMAGHLIQGITEFSGSQAINIAGRLLVETITSPRETALIMQTMGLIGFVRNAWEFITSDNVLSVYPGVHAMDANQLVDAQTALDNGWCIRAVSWHAGNGGGGEDFFPLAGGEYWYPHIISEKATYPLEYLLYWDRDYPPDPLKVYQR